MPKPSENITISVDETPAPLQLVLLGIQYAFMVCVYLVIVVIVVRAAKATPETARNAVSLAMIAAAAGTVLQALHRGPIGSGFLAPPVFSAIYLGPSILAAEVGGLPAVACMTVCAGLTEILVGAFLLRLRIVLQPVITGLTISIIALELGIVGLQHSLDVGGEGTTLFPHHVIVATLTFFVCVGCTVWGRGIWKLLCTLIGMIAGIIAALLLGLFDAGTLRQIAGAPWLAVPDPLDMSFTTHIALMPAFMAAGLAAAIRTVGVVTTCQKANDASWRRPDFANIRKGVLADGLGCTLGGILGAPGMNVGPSLVGVSIATGVTSRSVAWSCAAVLAVLAFVPKVADVLLQLPLSVAGALLVFTASLMLASGLQLMLVRTLDARFTFVIGLGLLLPLTRLVSPDYFDRLPDWLGIVANSGLALGLLSAITLLLIFRLGTRHRQTIIWKGVPDPVGELRRMLNERATDWSLTPAVIERAISNSHRAISLMQESGLIREPGSIAAVEHDGSLEVELRYIGAPLFIPNLTVQVANPNEETAAASGLEKIAIDVFPDRSATSSHGSESILRLGFDIQVRS